jgi:hypothetical protein
MQSEADLCAGLNHLHHQQEFLLHHRHQQLSRFCDGFRYFNSHRLSPLQPLTLQKYYRLLLLHRRHGLLSWRPRILSKQEKYANKGEEGHLQPHSRGPNLLDSVLQLERSQENPAEAPQETPLDALRGRSNPTSHNCASLYPQSSLIAVVDTGRGAKPRTTRFRWQKVKLNVFIPISLTILMMTTSRHDSELDSLFGSDDVSLPLDLLLSLGRSHVFSLYLFVLHADHVNVLLTRMTIMPLNDIPLKFFKTNDPVFLFESDVLYLL